MRRFIKCNNNTDIRVIFLESLKGRPEGDCQRLVVRYQLTSDIEVR